MSRRRGAGGIARMCLLGVAVLLGLHGDPRGAGRVAEAADPPWEVYVLTGQSNMLGTTGSGDPLPAPAAAAADERVAMAWSNVASTNTRFPPVLYGGSDGPIATLRVQQGDGKANQTFWGPEFGLARGLAAAGRKNLLLIKACRGGGSNSLWDKDTFDREPDQGHMWGHLRDTVRAALAEAGRDGRAFQVRGLLYLQGESNTADDAARSGERLASLAGNVRAVVEEIRPGSARGMRTIVAEIAASRATKARIATVAGHQRLAATDPTVAFVPTADLPLKSDGIHFGGEAKLEIGRRLAAALQQPQRGPGR